MKNNTFRSILLFIVVSFFLQGISAQGPGGIGNVDGSNGQPRLVMWLDASSLSLNNNDRVQTWTDLSGNNTHATAPSPGRRPVFRTNMLNGLPVISFNATQSHILNFDGNVLVNTDLTVSFVAARTQNNYQLVLGGTVGQAERNLHMGWQTSSWFLANHWGNNIWERPLTGGNGSGVNDFGIFTNRLGATETNPPRRLFQNAREIGNINNNNRLIAYEGAGIGSRNGVHYNVNVAEVIFFSHALNAAQMVIFHHYLAVKYNRTLDDGTNYFPHSQYSHDFIGIGHRNGQKHTLTSGSGGGLYLAEANNSLDEPNEFVFAAHSNTNHNTTTSGVPSGVTQRWTRDYYIHRIQGGTQGSGNTNVLIGFNFEEAELTATDNFYRLLFRENTTDPWQTLPGVVSVASAGEVWFTLTNDMFQSGYYTIGRTNETATTWYSYKDGPWDDPDTWTTDPGGSLLLPEGSTEIPGELDRVIIINDKRVTANINNISTQLLEVTAGAMVDFGTTTGHFFSGIRGQGTIKLAADNFPGGNANQFSHADGGTVEYYGNTNYNLSTPRVFNNVVIEMANASRMVTLLANYQLNGTLRINRGDLRINDENGTHVLHLTIGKDLFIESQGRISVGTGNTIGSYSISGNMPPLGQYHAIYHQVRIGRSMYIASGGEARFTNQNNPVYNQFTSNGAATVTFSGLGNSNLLLNGRADFYNLIIDKGNDQTFILEVNSSHPSHFNLYGPNNAGRRENSPFSAQNPEVRKALWIRNGTLKFTGSIHIPSLTEGNVAGGNGDYPIGSNGRLWIAGPDVTIYTTLSNAANNAGHNPNGGTGFNNSSGHTALSLYGSFRIDEGFFGTRHSAGFIFWSTASATVEINGGIVDVAQFRSSHTGGGGRTTYQQTGGHLRVRGGEAMWGEHSGGEVTGAFPMFGIIDPSGVFNMSGGEITILRRSRDDDDNSYGNNGFYVVSEDFNVTGGTLNIHLDGNNNPFYLHTTAPVWDLNITRRNTSNSSRVRLTHDLTIGNDLFIGDNSELHPRKAGTNDSPNHTLHIGRNFTLGSSTNSNARYFSMQGESGNRTIFFGSEDGMITVSNTSSTQYLEFFDLEINKSSHDNVIMLASAGRTPTPFTSGPYNSSPLEIRNSLVVRRGILDYDEFSIIIAGSTSLENHSTIGLPDKTGFLVFNATNQPQSMIAPFGAQPAFGNLVIDNNGGEVTLSGGADITVHNLGMRRGIFHIGTHALTIEKDIVNLTAGGHPDFGVNKMIRTAGNHSDGGILRKIDDEIPFLFPLGINTTTGSGNRYTPASITLSNMIEEGYVRVNNVDKELATLSEGNSADHALQYYWRVRHQGFTPGELPYAIKEFSFFNLPSAYATDINDYVVGKIVNLERKHTLGSLNFSSANLTLTFEHANTSNDPEGDALLEAGEFTAGHERRFDGRIEIFFSRLRGTQSNQNLWEDRNSWTTLSQLINIHGENVMEMPHLWHRSSNQAAPIGKLPTRGDIVIIGWVPWDDPQSSLRGDPHSIRIQGNQQAYCAEVRFNPMLDQDGNPNPISAAHTWGDGFFYRPTLTITGNGVLHTQIISGEGTLRNRQVDPNYSGIDMGEFVSEPWSHMMYEVFSNVTLNNIPEILPTLTIVPDGWGNNLRTVTIPRDIVVNYNLEIHGGAGVRMNSGALGDITVRGDLRLLRSHNHTRTRFEFQNGGTPRTLTVIGNLETEGSQAGMYVVSPGNNGVVHTFNLHGNYVQNATGAAPNTNRIIRLFTASNQGRVVLNLLGNNNVTFNGNMSSTAASMQLYRLNVDKADGSQAHIMLPMTLGGATDGDTKALTLTRGGLILDNSTHNITLTSGGTDFIIPSSATLTVRQGTINSSSSNIALGGTLILENATANLQGHVQYSSSGLATLEIHGISQLNIHGQLYSTTVNEGGILRYRQTGGNVVAGISQALTNFSGRGVVEIFNPGSLFEFSGGELTIVRGQSGTPSRAALFLNPSQYQVTEDAVLNIGATGYTDNRQVQIDAHIALPNLNILGQNTTAQLRSNNLTVSNDLFIGPLNTLNAQDAATSTARNLILQGNIINQGTPAFNSDTLFIRGNTQTIEGHIQVNRMIIQPLTSLTLEGSGTHLEVLGDLHFFNGTFNDQGNTLTAYADVYNYAIFESLSSTQGGLKLSGSATQRMYGNGTFGRLEIDKSGGEVILHGHLNLENNLALTLGRLNLRNYRLTLGQNSEITKPLSGDFGTNRMIYTNGLYTDGGLARKIPAISSGTYTFTFPLGVLTPQPKYTPVVMSYDQNTNPGMVSVSPNNSRHMTVPLDSTDVLQYHWWVETTGINNFTGRLEFHYHPNDITGNAGEYISAFLWDNISNDDFAWSKYFVEWVVEDENYFFVDQSGVSSFTGDFTAGKEPHIPANVPLFVSQASGQWNVNTNWRHAVTDEFAPPGGPAGFRVRIEPGHQIDVTNGRVSYRTEINGTLNIASTFGHNLGRINGTGTLRLESNQLPAGDFSQFFSNPQSTIVFDGSTNYTIPGPATNPQIPRYQNIVIRGSEEKSFPQGTNNNYLHIDIMGNLSIEESSFLRTREFTWIRLGGNLEKSTSATMSIMGSDNIMEFNGSSPQTVSGDFSGTNNKFHSVIMSNSTILYIDGTLQVNWDLSFDRGIIQTRGTGTFIQNKTDGLKFVAENSWFDGPYHRLVSHNSNASGLTNLFPLGHNGVRGDLYLQNPRHGSGSRIWSSEYYHFNAEIVGMSPATLQEPDLDRVSEWEFWSIESPSGAQDSRIKLGYSDESNINDDHPAFASNIAIAYWDAMWKPVGMSPYNYSVDFSRKTVLTGSTLDFSSKNTIKYVTFASKSPLLPLPIELLSFTAELDNDAVKLEWVTASEINNHYFTIERSRNGRDFEIVAVISSQAVNGYSTTNLYYEAWDLEPLEGLSYYRLKQTDFDGSCEYSDLVGIMIHQMSDVTFQLFPNPNSGNAFRMALSGLRPFDTMELQVISIAGRAVFSDRLYSDERGNIHSYIVPHGKLPKGVYLVNVSGLSGSFTLRMIVH